MVMKWPDINLACFRLPTNRTARGPGREKVDGQILNPETCTFFPHCRKGSVRERAKNQILGISMPRTNSSPLMVCLHTTLVQLPHIQLLCCNIFFERSQKTAIPKASTKQTLSAFVHRVRHQVKSLSSFENFILFCFAYICLTSVFFLSITSDTHASHMTSKNNHTIVALSNSNS